MTCCRWCGQGASRSSSSWSRSTGTATARHRPTTRPPSTRATSWPRAIPAGAVQALRGRLRLQGAPCAGSQGADARFSGAAAGTRMRRATTTTRQWWGTRGMWTPTGIRKRWPRPAPGPGAYPRSRGAKARSLLRRNASGTLRAAPQGDVLALVRLQSSSQASTLTVLTGVDRFQPSWWPSECRSCRWNPVLQAATAFMKYRH